MKKTMIYMLYDVIDGAKFDRFYLDKESAEIALHEHYEESFIEEKRAMVLIKPAVSYLDF